jgi:hypothetical protein
LEALQPDLWKLQAVCITLVILEESLHLLPKVIGEREEWIFVVLSVDAKCALQRQSHSKPKKLASHAQREGDVPVNFS